jgi:hypothetical protein
MALAAVKHWGFIYTRGIARENLPKKIKNCSDFEKCRRNNSLMQVNCRSWGTHQMLPFLSQKDTPYWHEQIQIPGDRPSARW